jgi:hypothetical protein
LAVCQRIGFPTGTAASCVGFVDQVQDYGINAIGSGARRDDHYQHEGI